MINLIFQVECDCVSLPAGVLCAQDMNSTLMLLGLSLHMLNGSFHSKCFSFKQKESAGEAAAK